MIAVERGVVCRSPASALWDVIADTNRLNRAAGLERVRFEMADAPGPARVVAHAVLGGIPVTYDEYPFEWEQGKWLQVRRVMRNGPLKQIVARFRLDPDPAGTRVVFRTELEPRIALLGPIARFQAARACASLAREAAAADAALLAGGGIPQPGTRSVREEVLARALAALDAARPSPLNARLARHVAEGGDLELQRMRPYALADAWGEERREVLSACLAAVPAGLLELRWEVVCPSCRNGGGAIPTLAELAEHGQCHFCEIAFSLDFDETVEATFSPATAVRVLDVGPWCSGGPARMPHVVTQGLLPTRGSTVLAAPGAPGRYRVFVRGGATTPLSVEEGGAPEVDARGELARVAPGGRVRVSGEYPDERHVKVEHVARTNDAATARDVTALAAFRASFSSDTLKPGLSLRVSRVAVFFSDLTDSTRLYARAGDAAAFRLVQDHFDVLRVPLEAHGGAIVKTIGDAVMAVFADEDDALRASLGVLDAFRAFRAAGGLRAEVDVKLGLYTGPCYVCTANGVLDYFGQSVNIAARLQGTARAGELVVPEALAARATGAEIVERFVPVLKGVDAPIAAARLRLG